MVKRQPSKLFHIGSSPIDIKIKRMAEWFKAATCKVVVVTRRGFESYSFQKKERNNLIG